MNHFRRYEIHEMADKVDMAGFSLIYTRKVLGPLEKLTMCLAVFCYARFDKKEVRPGNKINTSYVERNNGTIRHMDARCVRKTFCFSKCQENHERQLALSLSYYHHCRPHKTLMKRYGRPTTPFMAANLTDRVWSMGDLLRFKSKKRYR